MSFSGLNTPRPSRGRAHEGQGGKQDEVQHAADHPPAAEERAGGNGTGDDRAEQMI